MILETDRLILRKIVPDDWDHLAAILQDERVMYAYEHAFSDVEVTEWLQNQLRRYEDDGIGLWAVIRKSDGQFIGQCGLTMQDCHQTRVMEIGYLFRYDAWHQGYALESALACKDYAWDVLGWNEVFSIIRDNNIASMNVAIRNGMVIRDRLVKHYWGVEMPHLVFSVKKSS